MASDVEHLFKCLFDICLSSFLGCLTLFFSRLFTFLLLKHKSSLHILDCIPLSDVSFAKIFSSLFFALSFSEQKLIILIKSSVTGISAWIVILRLHLKSHYPWWPLDAFRLCVDLLWFWCSQIQAMFISSGESFLFIHLQNSSQYQSISRYYFLWVPPACLSSW